MDTIESLSPVRDTHFTNHWCKQMSGQLQGISNHSKLDNALLLLHLRDYGWKSMNDVEKKYWTMYWRGVYRLQSTLSIKQLKIIDEITDAIALRREKKPPKRR